MRFDIRACPQTMQDENSAPGNAGMNSANGAAAQIAAGKENEANRSSYSIPGILHFIQHEWSRFEIERSQWEVEKAELQARIAFLQGERKGQENLKNDLVRRIKMLEYALKQERAKYSKLKFGGDGNVDLNKATPEEDGLEMPHLDGDNFIQVSNVNWRQGRQLLRQYLQELGYTDTIIDVRSNRVKSLLGIHEQGENDAEPTVNGETARRNDNNGAARNRAKGTTLAEEMLIDTEAAVMANFDFLQSEVEVDDDDEVMDDNEDGYNPDQIKLKSKFIGADAADQVDKDTEEVLNEFNFLTTGGEGNDFSDGNTNELRSNAEESAEWGLSGSVRFSPSAGGAAGSGRSPNASGGDRAEMTAGNLELGELEQLTITNENEASYDQITAPKEAFRKTWSAKYTLRSHFDGVRALGFHPTEPVLITASEDQTMKLWNLQKTIPAKKSAALDVEPVYTFRAHQGPVLSLSIAPAGDLVFSGGIDSTIRCWNMPSPNIDPYDTFEPSVLSATLLGHTDAVWGLSYHGTKQQLLSCSADGTVKLWNPRAKTLLKTFGSGGDEVPTSVDWVYEDSNAMVTAYSNGACIIYDIESGKPVIKLDTNQESGGLGAITKVVSHPTLPLTITAHEDRHIRFFDNNSGKQTHAMVAHLEAVTSLAVDSNGLYLLSGSHDCSIRLWNLETKTCVQEITAHRKKFDESIFDVAFHPTKPFIASAGADALAKVFV